MDPDYEEINDKINNDTLLREWKQLFRFLPPWGHGIFLSIIAKNSLGRLDASYVNDQGTRDTFTSPSLDDLRYKMDRAWKTGSFREILDLDYLKSRPTYWTNQGLRDAVHAWNVPYQTDVHRMLLKNINNIMQHRLSPGLGALIQSSGAGKSRMVHEMANLVFTLPINIRTTRGIRVAFPPTDHPLFEYLVKDTQNYFSATESGKHYAIFLRCLFCHTAKELSQFVGQPQRTREEFASMWRERMNDRAYRLLFYAEVVNMCRSNLTDNLLSLSDLVSKAASSLDTLTRTLQGLYESTPGVQIVLYMDEAHELKGNLKGGSHNQLDVLCSVLAGLQSASFYCLFISTQYSLQRLPSQFGAVFTETPFDCAPDLKLYTGVLHMADITKLSFLPQFGRPLWWAMIHDSLPGGASKECRANKLVEFARMKLLCYNAINTPHNHVDQAAQLAVLDVLLALDFKVITEPLQAEMIRAHMRLAYSIPASLERVWSWYSSEPILAEAAAQQLDAFQNAFREDPFQKAMVHGKDSNVMLHILRAHRRTDRVYDTLDFGMLGQVLVRALLMQAYVEAVRSAHGDQPLNFGRGCTLVGFIGHLFSADVAAQILSSHPDNIGSRGRTMVFRDVFANAVVRFTHFARADDEGALCTRSLCPAFVRGTAIVCTPVAQSVVQVAIPVLLDKAAALEESVVSAVLVQLRPNGRMVGLVEQAHVGLFPEHGKDGAQTRPYVTMTVDVCEQPGEGEPSVHVGSPPEVNVHPEPVPTSAIAPALETGTAEDSPMPMDTDAEDDAYDTHPRFNFTVVGCDSDRPYNSKILPEHQAAWARDELVAQPGLEVLDGYAHRDDPKRVESIMRMKPVWLEGKASYHWIECETTNA